MTRITWVKGLSDTEPTPVSGQFFDMAEPLVTMIDPDNAEYKGVRRNSYIYKLMIEAGYTEKGKPQ